MYQLKTIIFAIIICIAQAGVVSNTFAQTDYQGQYIQAKNHFNEGRYKQAMEAFKPLIVYDKNNPFSQYASFYYALSAYQQSYQSVAKDMLLQIKQLYPEWEKMDEVNLWLARIHFDNQEYYRAMALLNGIAYAGMQKDISDLKYHYFQKEKSVAALEMLYKEFPDEPGIGRSYAKAIINQPLAEQNQELLNELITKFKLPKDEFAVNVIPRSVKKDKYTVAVLFPFAVNNLQPNLSRKPNQFVLDLYDGIVLAVDTLRKQGIEIELLVFDTERSAKITEQILQNPQLKKVDLIVGPLYRDPIRLVTEFAAKHKINVVNPISSDREIVDQNPFSFLFNPAFETMGAKSAEHMSRIVHRRKAGMIISGDQKKDTVLASSFKKIAIEQGLEVVADLRFSRESSQRITDMLATPTELDDKKRAVDFTLKRDSLGWIFVTTDDPLIYMKVISSIEARGDSIKVIGSENWLESATIDFTSFERLGISLYAPTYYNFKSYTYKRFLFSFINRYGRQPSNHARMGYELMMNYGTLLHQHGNYFQHALQGGAALPGVIFSGLNYGQSRDNMLVPIVRFNAGELQVLSK